MTLENKKNVKSVSLTLMRFMFIRGKFDRVFGPVVVFAFGGIYVEVFKDVQTCLCPADPGLVRKKIESLKFYAILKGAREMKPADVDGYVDCIARASWLLAEFQEIKELDINPLRLFQDKPGVRSLLVPFFSQGAALIRAVKSIGASHAPSGHCLNQA